MANQYYNQKWQEAIAELQEPFALEMAPLENETTNQPKGFKMTDGQRFLFYANLYIKYIEIYKKLEDCYDQIVHPQKRQLLREMLDNTMVQMCQTKYKVVKFNTGNDWNLRNDFVNLDELIMDLKLMPDCIEVPIPRFCKEDEKAKLDERNALVNQLLIDYTDTDQPELEQFEEKSPVVDVEQALMIISRYERGRIGIEYVHKAQIDRKLYLQKQEKKKRLIDTEEETGKDEAVQVLTKYWRGTIDRLKVQKMREQEMKFLGIKLDLDENEESDDELDCIYKIRQDNFEMKKTKLEKMNSQREKMKLIQQQHQNDYQSDLDTLQNLVRDNEGADIKEKMLEERRKWIFEQIEMNEFQDVPQSIEEFNNRNNVLDQQGQEALNKKMEEDAKKKTKKDDKKGKKGGKGSDLDEFMNDHKPMGPSEEMLMLQKLIEQYSAEWSKKDEQQNFEQRHETVLAMEKVKPNVEAEIQQIVDDMIEIELDNIRLSFGKKKKKPKKKKNPKIKGSKKKFPGDAFNKGKDPRDILAFLIEKGVVKKFLPARLKDMLGEHNVLGSLQERQQEYMSDPSMLQLRQCMAEQIGIPLGSQFARDKLERNFFFLFYGPQGTGKTMAVRALATECNAIVIDISPSNLENKFSDNKQLQGCINSAFRVAQAFQPAIIYCQDMEMIFQGKKKKGQGPSSTFFTKMKKPLTEFKNKKFLQPEIEKIEGDKKVKYQIPDRVVFVGCYNKPSEGSTKDMRNFFDKKFYFPYPNYATRKLLFQHFVNSKGVEIPENFVLSTIAHITDGFSAGSFKIAVDKVLTERRLLRIKEEPIKISEFIGPISNTHSTFGDELKNFKIFTDDVCYFKERREKQAPQDDKDKKGGKKGKK